MVADIGHAGPGGADGASEGPDGACDERWQRIWNHREHLLKVARRRSVSMEDAEDAVHEAMVRGMENPHVEDDRLGAWLTTVTMRLCVDRHRQLNRDADARTRSALAMPEPATVEEAVCDRAEARWLTVRSEELPARQAEALRLKAEDLDVGQVAHRMGLSYQAVESLLARARRTLRSSLAGTLAVAAWVWAHRPRTGGTTRAVTLTSAAATIAVLGFVMPYSHRPGPGPQPESPAPESIARTASSTDAAPPQGAAEPSVPAATPDGRSGTTPSPVPAPTTLGELVPLMIGLPLPAVPEPPVLSDTVGDVLPLLTESPHLGPTPGIPRVEVPSPIGSLPSDPQSLPVGGGSGVLPSGLPTGIPQLP